MTALPNAEIEELRGRLDQQARALAAARREAEAVERDRQALLSTMAHELRTPMTAIVGFAELMADPSCDVALRGEHARVVKRNSQRLLSLFENVSDLSRVEDAGEQMETSIADPEVVVRSAVRSVGDQAEAKGLSLELAWLRRPEREVLLDVGRLGRVAKDMVRAAVRLAASGEVLVRGDYGRGPGAVGWLSFEVVASGARWREGWESELFQPVGDGSDGSGIVGLRLSVCRHLARLMGGEITAERAGPKEGGEGLVFRFRAPAVAAGEGAGETDSPKGPARLDGLRVLVAEDGPENRRLVVFHLRRAGAEVAVACDGVEAVDLSRARVSQGAGFDAVVMDVQMPRMDGVEATRTLRDEGFGAPIVMLTATATPEMRARCAAAGSTAFLTKPFDPAELCECVAGCAGGRRAAA